MKRGVINIPFAARRLLANTALYLLRVAAGSGLIRSISAANQAYLWMLANGITPDIYIEPEMGRVERPDGILRYISKLFSLDATPNDLAQSTANLQPYLAGHIAPTEKYAIKNVHGEGKYMTHNVISYAANQAWTLHIFDNYDGSALSNASIIGTSFVNTFRYRYDGNNSFHFRSKSNNEGNFSFSSSAFIIGKALLKSLVYDGANTLTLFIDGIEYSSCTVAADIDFGRIINTEANLIYFGKIGHYSIYSAAFSDAQVLDFYNTLIAPRFPAIPTVTIGNKEIATSNFEAVATPVGTVIPEVQSAVTWSTSKALYDAAIAGGATVRNALIAAAMWRYPDNTTTLGATYGKIFNGYAAKLFATDMLAQDYGYHPATQAELDYIVSELGGDALAGGEMKVLGTSYWTTPNTGADNGSGLTVLGGGYIDAGGGFTSLGTETYLIASDESDDRVGGYIRLIAD